MTDPGRAESDRVAAELDVVRERLRLTEIEVARLRGMLPAYPSPLALSAGMSATVLSGVLLAVLLARA